MDGFSGVLDTGWAKDQKMTKGKLIDGKKLWIGLKVNYSISSKIRQISLHWGYELTEKDFFVRLTN